MVERVPFCGRYSLTKRKLDLVMILHCKIDVRFTIMQEIIRICMWM